MRKKLNKGQYHNYMEDYLLRHDHHHPHCTAYGGRELGGSMYARLSPKTLWSPLRCAALAAWRGCPRVPCQLTLPGEAHCMGSLWYNIRYFCCHVKWPKLFCCGYCRYWCRQVKVKRTSELVDPNSFKEHNETILAPIVTNVIFPNLFFSYVAII